MDKTPTLSMKLSTDDYDPGRLERSYPYFGDVPYPPPSEPVRAVLTCLPEVRGPPRSRKTLATDIVSTLHELDIDPVVFAELMDTGSTKHIQLPEPSASAAEATFDAEYEYQYEYLSDVATIELAARPSTPLYEPFVSWRVEADAGIVAGTNGKFGSFNGSGSIKLLDVVEAVQYGDDEECPVIAGARFEELPVPGRIARELNDRLSEMRVLTSPDADASLGSDPTAFPTELHDPVISDTAIQEPFAWDADRFIMWYEATNIRSFDLTPYQIENGMLVARTQAHRYRERELPDSREELIDLDGLDPISPDALAD